MKTGKTHGKGLEWLYDYDGERDRAFRRGDFPEPSFKDDTKTSVRKRKRTKK